MPAVAEHPSLGKAGPYRLVSVLGQGGMGVVFRAVHVDTGAEVALKTVNTISPERMLALRMEISALREVKHPGVVRILDEGVEGGVPWYAMELLRGDTLAGHNRSIWRSTVGVSQSGVSAITPTDLVDSRTGPRSDSLEDSGTASEPPRSTPTPTPTSALRLYRALCEPLVHIHARGMVHRDLKPSNVFVTDDGRVVVMDFGLFSYAMGAVGREILDAGERAIGTIQYLAPERIQGRQGDARSDLYSFGCMLYETLTGRPPFLGNARQVIAQHLSAAAVPISELVDGVPSAVDEFVLSLLAKSPQQRIGHASDLVALIDSVLGDRTPASSAGAMLFRPELSGRSDVLAILQGRLQEATEGAGSLVLLRGESGIGKTFLGSEFSSRAARSNFRVVTGECAPGTSNVPAGPLHPLRRLLQSIADYCQRADPAEQERILGGCASYLAPFDSSMAAYAAGSGVPAAETLPGPASAERVIAVLGETLREFAKTAPVLLVIDDLQWVDHLSLDFLASLDRDFFVGVPLVVIGTFRSDEAPEAVHALSRSEVCTSIVLQRLDEQAATAMIGDMLAMAPPDHLVRFLVAQSAGNPFFIAEYLRYLVTSQHLTRRRGHWAVGGAGPDEPDYASIDVPKSLQELVLRRLQTLSAQTQRVTRAAAVLGREFEIRALSAVAELDDEELLASLREAQERDVLEVAATGGFRFVHDKLRETAYGSIPPGDVARLHARAAAALEANASQPDATIRETSDVARHHKLAGNLVRALDFFEKAGEAAVATSAQKDAAPFLREALQIAEVVGGVPTLRRARWERELGSALYDSGEVGEGRLHLERALTLLQRPIPKHPAAMGGSLAVNLLLQTGHRILGERVFRPRGEDPQSLLEAARTYDRLQQAFYYAGDALPMLYACVRTLNLAELAGPSADLTVAYANATAVAGIIPAPKLVDVYRTRALGNIRAAQDAASETYFCMLSGVYLTGIGSWKEAGETLERGLAIAKRLNYARRIREITGAQAIHDFLSGAFDVGLARADAMHAIAVQKDPQTQCWALLSSAQIRLAQGNVAQVLTDVRAADDLVAKLGRPERIWSLSLEAAAHARAGAFDAANETSARALVEIRQAPPVNHYTIDAHAICAEVRILLATRGGGERRKRRAELLRPAHDAARALRGLVRVFPVAKPRSRLIDGLVHELEGQSSRAARCFQESLESARALEMAYDEARVRLKLATVSSADRAEHLAIARGLMSKLGILESPLNGTFSV